MAEPAPPTPDPAQPDTPPTSPDPADSPLPPGIGTPASTGAPGILGPFTVSDSTGSPINHYDIYADTGAWDNFTRPILLFFANLLFGLDRMWTGFTVWLLDWALQFGLIDILTAPLQAISDTFRTGVLDGADLRLLAFTIAGLGIAWLWWSGRAKAGMRELALTVVIGAAALTVLANPVGMLFGDNGLLAHTRDFSLEVAALGLGSDQAGATELDQVAAPLTNALIDTLIRKPHQLLNYGTVLDQQNNPHACLDTYNQIVADGPWWGGDYDTVHDQMAACDTDLAKYNESNLADRLLGTLLATVAAIIVNIIIDGIALGLIITPVLLAWEAILLLFAAVIAIMPGAARAVLWARVKAVLAACAGVLAAVLFLTLFLSIISALLTADLGIDLSVRFLVVDFVAIAGWIKRKQLSNVARRAAHTMGRRLDRSGGMAGGFAGGAVGGLAGGGFSTPYRHGGLSDPARQWMRTKYEVRQSIDPYRKAGRWARKTLIGPAARNTTTRTAARSHAATPTDTTGTGGAATVGQHLLRRLDRTRIGRAGHQVVGTAATATGTALKYTIGAPVYLPRAVTQAKDAAARRGTALRAELGTAAARRARTAAAFGREYYSNAQTAATFTAHAATTATGARHLARAARIATPDGLFRIPPTPADQDAALEAFTVAALAAADTADHEVAETLRQEKKAAAEAAAAQARQQQRAAAKAAAEAAAAAAQSEQPTRTRRPPPNRRWRRAG